MDTYKVFQIPYLALTLFQFSLIHGFPSNTSDGSLSYCDIMANSSREHFLICGIKPGQILDYRSVRNLTGKETNLKYSVKVVCAEGGAIWLPWPFKAKNVRSLEVTGCIVEGFLTEMTQRHAIPDELQTLVLSSVSVDLPLTEMIAMHNNVDNIPQDTDCGPLTLESLTLRDVHYDLKVSPEERYGLSERMSSLLQRPDAKHQTIVQKRCEYRHLKYLDESGSRKSGRYHLKLLPEYSLFPKLEVYNMSNNDLLHMPTSLRNLHSAKYPMLRHLDFSNNALSEFELEFPQNLRTCHVKYVDLSGNHIASIPKASTEQLKAIGTILVDLRFNPLQCSCALAPFRQYLKTHYVSTTNTFHRKLVSDITCTDGATVAGQMKQFSLLDYAFDKICPT